MAPPAVLLVPGDLRAQLAHLLADARPDVPVVAYEELMAEVEIVEAGRVSPGGPGERPPAATPADSPEGLES